MKTAAVLVAVGVRADRYGEILSRALMLVAARLRHLAATRWSRWACLDMDQLREASEPAIDSNATRNMGETKRYSARECSTAAARDRSKRSRGPLALPDQDQTKSIVRILTDTAQFRRSFALRFLDRGGR